MNGFFQKTKNLTLILSLVGLFLLTTGISMAVFSYLKKPAQTASSQDTSKTRSRINPDLPKTEACPINGAMFTKAEKDIWGTRRPIAAMIENHLDSRPQSGLSKADVIYEAVAEGGITRFLGVFYCGAAAEDVRIGPVRSSRVYFIDWASEYGPNPLYVHVGGANNICQNCPGGVKPSGTVAKDVRALEELIDIGWRYKDGNALDGGANVGIPEMWRDYERIPGAVTEHTYMASTDKLADLGIKRGFGYKGSDGISWDKNFVSWKFIDDKPQSPKASDISFEFWSNKPDYNVEWKYDEKNNRYLRFNGGKEHMDMDSKEQLMAKNVVIQLTKERGPVDKEGHMFYTTTGTGKAIVFQNGDVIDGTWQKSDRVSRTKFFDKSGREISFVKGTIWIEVVPSGNKINY